MTVPKWFFVVRLFQSHVREGPMDPWCVLCMLGEALASIERCVSKTADQCDKPRSRQNREDPVAELLFEHCCAGKCFTSHVLDPGALREHSWLISRGCSGTVPGTRKRAHDKPYDNTHDKPHDHRMTNSLRKCVWQHVWKTVWQAYDKPSFSYDRRMTTHIDYFQYLIFCHSSIIHACFGRHTCTCPCAICFFSPSECTCAIHPSCALCGTNALLHCCILRVLLRYACVMRHCGPSQSHARIHLSTQTTASSLQSDLPPPRTWVQFDVEIAALRNAL